MSSRGLGAGASTPQRRAPSPLSFAPAASAGTGETLKPDGSPSSAHWFTSPPPSGPSVAHAYGASPRYPPSGGFPYAHGHPPPSPGGTAPEQFAFSTTLRKGEQH
jgi:hypothetical protein